MLNQEDYLDHDGDNEGRVDTAEKDVKLTMQTEET
jgi:hypothetical protein